MSFEQGQTPAPSVRLSKRSSSPTGVATQTREVPTNQRAHLARRAHAAQEIPTNRGASTNQRPTADTVESVEVSDPFYRSMYPWPLSVHKCARTKFADFIKGNPDGPASSRPIPHNLLLLSFIYVLICQQYLLLFLLIPSLYFFRVDQVLKSADLTIEEITYLATRNRGSGRIGDNTTREKNRSQSSTQDNLSYDPQDLASLLPSYEKLRHEWKDMIRDFVEEWKTLNVVSAVLVPGILTFFQIDGASNDPVTRSLAFLSLILALWSLVYGCLYVIQFRRMHNAYTIVDWALEARNNAAFWNPWIMLALPAVSLAWSVLIFLISVVWFMWRSTAEPPPIYSFPAPPSTEFGFRIAACAILGIAAVYFALALVCFYQYGEPMANRWERRVKELLANIHISV